MDNGKFLQVLIILFVLASSGCSQAADNSQKIMPVKALTSSVPPLQVTVYNSNLGVVKESRSLDLVNGLNSYSFVGVASLIDPTSVKLRSNDMSFSVLEQNYEYDLVNKAKILEKYVGEKISGYRIIGDSKEIVEGKLLSSNGNEVIIEKSDGTIGIIYLSDLQLPKLPDGLITKPTLTWMIDSKGAGAKSAELSYMTSGMNWNADYVIVVGKDDDIMDLNGWVTVTNNAGTTFENAVLKLVAGDVNRVYSDTVSMMKDRMYAVGSVAEEAQFSQQQLFEYHMYDLLRPTTLKDKQQKQISLLSSQGVEIEKEYVYESQGGWYSTDNNKKVQVKLNFKNSQDNGLGIPLPKGRMRVFKNDEQSSLQFIGEDYIDHTPKDETLRILMGNAFDIVGERKRMQVRDLGCKYDVSWEVTLRNHKSEDVIVTVLERGSWDWDIISENFPHVRESNEKIEYKIPVKADGETKLAYTIRYNNC